MSIRGFNKSILAGKPMRIVASVAHQEQSLRPILTHLESGSLRNPYWQMIAGEIMRQMIKALDEAEKEGAFGEDGWKNFVFFGDDTDTKLKRMLK